MREIVEPTDEDIEAIVKWMDSGVGYHRACDLHEVPHLRGKRWLARGNEHLTGSHAERHGQFAKLARKVAKSRARVVARAEGVIAKALQGEDEDRALGTAKWILPRLAGREYAERTMALSERQRVAETLIEELRDEMSAEAYAEMIAALERCGAGERAE